MAKRTKTMSAVVAQGNDYFANSPAERKEERQMLQHFVSQLLMKANCYGGFNYLYWTKQGCQEWINCGSPEGKDKDFFMYGPSGDQTRIFFY